MSKGLVHLILLFFIVFQLTVVSLAASDMEFVNVGSPFINLEQIDKQKLANVSAILEDQKGFIWLVNESGLLRFDGKQFKLFPELAQFSSPEVEFLGEGANGQIWIVTHDSKLASFDTINSKLTFHSLYQFEALNNEGAELIEINGLDIKGETLYLFTKNRILMINEQRFSLIKEVVVPIAENDNLIRIAVTDAGEIWASSFHGSGPMLFDGTDWQFFTHDKKDKTTISAELVLKIFEDSQKRVWFGTYSGLDLYLPESKQFKRYPPRDLNAEENKNLGIIGNLVSGITEDDQGNLWLSVYHGGVFKFEPENEKFHHYQSVKDVKSTNISNAMTLHPGVIFMDRQQTLWSQTQKGISRLTKGNRDLTQWVNIERNKCLPNAIHEGEQAIFFGCDNALYELKNGEINYVADFNKDIYSIVKGKKNDIWVGTNGDGLYRYDLETFEVQRYAFDSNEYSLLNVNMVWFLRKDKNGDIYGLLGQHPEEAGSAIIHYDDDNDAIAVIPAEYKYSGYLDIGDKLLLLRGFTQEKRNLFWFDKLTHQREQLPFETGYVHAAVRQHDEVWLATADMGLVHLNISSGQLNRVSLDIEGKVTGIYLDEKKDELIVSIKNHIYQLNKSLNGDFKTSCLSCTLAIELPTLNHRQFGQLYITNSFLASSGQFFVRTTNRLMAIPLHRTESVSPKGALEITDYKIMGTSVAPNAKQEDAPLSQAIEHSQEITIQPSTTLISFSFAKLGVIQPEKVHYAYMLEGLNDDWVYTDASRTEAIYSLLPAGDYTFKVKATNDNGVWVDEIKTLNITVLPPWWRTWWAYLIYFLVSALSLSSLLWLYHRKKIVENERQSLLALNRTKEQLFANLSHEFRTPLTLVMGPAQAIQSQSKDETIQYHANLIEKNAQRLLSMVDQLLELAQLNELLPDDEKPQHVASVCTSVVQAFQTLATERNVSLFLGMELNENCWVSGPANALETIFNNLLNNAIKYTRDGGSISIDVLESAEIINISVSDTGCGIAKDEQERIFERFTRLENTAEYVPGTGIGLALVKELVEKMGGIIYVESKIEQGAKFTFELPKASSSKEQMHASEHNEDLRHEGINQEISSVGELDLAMEQTSIVNQDIEGSDKTIVLVIDDNTQMRSFIRISLEADYHVIEAANGVEGVQKAAKYSPDMIISDVMMPKMDGFELLANIRADMATSHIPVILLTAKGDQQSKLRGLSDLADDFITKPFEPQQLKIRMQNLLGIRALLRVQFDHTPAFAHEENEFPQKSKNLDTENRARELSLKDRQFIDKINEFFEREHTNTELSMAVISEYMAMSDRQVQRKIKALSGSTFSELLRDYRLTQACTLLDEGEQVAVVADQVGFNSSSYFVRCFKAKYGQTPNEYRRAN